MLIGRKNTRSEQMASESILDEVARATRLREGPSGVLELLRIVYRRGSARLQDVAREARLPLPVATAVRRELEKSGLLERKHGLTLTEKGRVLVEGDFGFRAKIDVGCPTCQGHGIVVPDSLRPIVDRLTEIVAAAPSVDVTLDQAPCTPETSVRRALLMLHGGALEGRRVLLLGDDDSVCIAIGLLSRALGKDDLTRGVTVIDADQRQLSFLHDVADREGLAITFLHHDLRKPLPFALVDKFDVIETDPPYTLEGARLFLARGCEAIAGEGDGLCFFSFAHRAPAETLQLQEIFLELGLAVRAVRAGFNQYMGATVLGNVGQLIELTRAGRMTSSLPSWTGPLYTADLNPRSRVYGCANCGREATLGEDGAPTTIEELKLRGCPMCGGTTFRRSTLRS
jgi:predicted methyltransferase/DNA-directed RNA polymerase subunit RPC12/RpoP